MKYSKFDAHYDADHNAERDAREAMETREAERDARMESFHAGRVSYRAAVRGGDEYSFEMRESAQLAEPIAAAVFGWMRGQRVAFKAVA